MPSPTIARLCWSAAALGAVVGPGTFTRASAQSAEIREWKVPWEQSRPRDPYLDRDGQVWFVGQAGNYIARLDPAGSRFQRYELDPGTFPHNLIVDAKGFVWYAGNGNGTIGRLDPATGKITRYSMPDPAARDPHTLVFDRNGDIWFTVQRSNFIGKLTVAAGSVRLVPVPTPGALPYGIGVDGTGRPWFVEFGSNKLATVDPATFKVTEYILPRPRARPRRIAITSDGRVWYVDYAGGMLGRFDPRTEKFSEWAMPAGGSAAPYAMAADDRDRVWFVETGPQPNRLVGFAPKTEKFFGETPIAGSGGLTVRHMIYHPGTKALWFGTDANTIGRALVPEARPVP
ncbi:MAG: lyase [Deltaproteobacteria bacterium]